MYEVTIEGTDARTTYATAYEAMSACKRLGWRAQVARRVNGRGTFIAFADDRGALKTCISATPIEIEAAANVPA